jgi:hypothetical protein
MARHVPDERLWEKTDLKGLQAALERRGQKGLTVPVKLAGD